MLGDTLIDSTASPCQAASPGRVPDPARFLSRPFVWPDQPADRLGSGWYEALWLWLALAALSVLPFLVTPYPPLTDFYSHVGRYHVMLEHGRAPLLDRYYAFEWGLIPNLGQDLLMVPVGRLLGAERGALLLAALIPPLTVLGVRSLSLAVHGRVQPLALLAMPFAYSYSFLFGFMNYHTGVVVVIGALVAWYRLRDRPILWRLAFLAIASFAAWLAHLSAWALLCCAIGLFELAAAFRHYGWRPLAALPRLIVTAAVLLLPVLLMFGKAAGDPEKFVYPGLMRKLHWFVYPLRDEWKALDFFSIVLIALAVFVCLIRDKLRFDPAMAAFAALTLLLFCVIPTGMRGGYYADMRLLPVLWIAGLLAARLIDGRRLGTAIAIVAIGLFCLRIGVTAQAWHKRGALLERDLAALDHVPPGARIFAMTPERNCKSWASEGLSHLPSLAIVRRQSYVNTEWKIPGQQLMQPAYDTGPGFDVAPMVSPPDRACQGRIAAEALDRFPRDRFDFVWLFGVPLPPSASPWLTPVFRGPRGVLYAVNR